VPVEITPNRKANFREANKRIGRPDLGDRPPEGFTWHEVEDGKTMLLVPEPIHKIPHTGGVVSAASEVSRGGGK
jgi:hypothetical protein